MLLPEAIISLQMATGRLPVAIGKLQRAIIQLPGPTYNCPRAKNLCPRTITFFLQTIILRLHAEELDLMAICLFPWPINLYRRPTDRRPSAIIFWPAAMNFSSQEIIEIILHLTDKEKSRSG
jgi:hypothetical protein